MFSLLKSLKSLHIIPHFGAPCYNKVWAQGPMSMGTGAVQGQDKGQCPLKNSGKFTQCFRAPWEKPLCLTLSWGILITCGRFLQGITLEVPLIGSKASTTWCLLSLEIITKMSHFYVLLFYSATFLIGN